MTEIRQRVVCYITRGKRELLVFEHHDPALQAGIQVVAGGIDEGETPAEAAIREALEEAGLNLENPVFLGSIDKHWIEAKNPNQHWHFYWLEVPSETPDAWDHTVTAGEDDMGMVYRQRFVKLEDVKLDWGLDAKLSALVQHIWKSGSDREWMREGMLRYETQFLAVIKRFEELSLTDLFEARDYLDHGESGLAYGSLCYAVIETEQKFSSELIDDLLELGAGFDYESGVFQDGDLEYFEYALNELRLVK